MATEARIPDIIAGSGATMGEDLLFRLLALLERLGVWLAVAAWLAIALGTAAMALVLRNERVTI
jgi:hypothetical protein